MFCLYPRLFVLDINKISNLLFYSIQYCIGADSPQILCSGWRHCSGMISCLYADDVQSQPGSDNDKKQLLSMICDPAVTMNLSRISHRACASSQHCFVGTEPLQNS